MPAFARQAPLWRSPAALCAAFATWLCVTPALALSVDDARHLLSRTGFGAAPHEIEALLPLSRTEAAEAMARRLQPRDPQVPPPAHQLRPSEEDMKRLGDYPPQELMAPGVHYTPHPTSETRWLEVSGVHDIEQAKVWWIDEMLSTPAPQAERLALFWHNHFTSVWFDVSSPRMMLQQHLTLRRLAAGSYRELLRAMLRDPAMLVFLDNAISLKGKPNENLARELLELFTLGIGHYSQQDIKEVARALSGLSVDFGGTWEFKYRLDQADTGVKTFLGRTGPWNADDIVDIILAQPRAAEWLAEKLYREYVSLELDAVQVARLAEALRANRFEIAPVLAGLWKSEAFWAPTNRGALVKSPVDLVVGFCRTFGVASLDGEILASFVNLMGQKLFDPPNVAGWAGGTHWVSPHYTSLRRDVIAKLWQLRSDVPASFDGDRRDLLVRLSGEHSGNGQEIRYRVRVNDREVEAGGLRHTNLGTPAGFFWPKPVWQTVRIARNRLPAAVDSVTVEFDQQEPNTAMFVNWVQVDGNRFSVPDAKPHWPQGSPCGPKGMMYCRSSLRFDTSGAAVPLQEQVFRDRNYTVINSHVEYATTRLQLTAVPAGLAPLDAFRTLGPRYSRIAAQAAREGGRDAATWAAILPVAPMVRPPDRGSALPADLDVLRALTLDFAYNLN